MHQDRAPRVDEWVAAALSRISMVLFVLLCSGVAPTWAEAPVGEKAAADRTAENTIVTVEKDLAAARKKLTTGPSGSLARMVASGVATAEERDEWTLLLNVRIASLERHLEALRSLEYEAQSQQELKRQAQAWSGFAQPPPYSIDFIDELWGNFSARQQDIDAARIAHSLISTQINVLRGNLESLQKNARQADERARDSAPGAASEQARLDWLSELAHERVLTTVAALGQYEAMLKFRDESMARLNLARELLQRQIGVATRASPMTQAELDGKLERNTAKRIALEQELASSIRREQQVEAMVRTARADLERKLSEAKVGHAADKAGVELAQTVLDTRKAQAETAMLRQEALRLLMDLTLGTEQIWRTRFALASKPGSARLREIHTRLTGFNERIALWKQYLANSMDAAAGLADVAEKRLAERAGGTPERGIAETQVETYRERQELFARVRTELTAIELLLKRMEQEVLLQENVLSGSERFKDMLDRMTSGAAELWGLEVFAVKDTITVEGREITGSSSITVGKITTVILILTLGLWLASKGSAGISTLLRKRFRMNTTAATLLERGIYILSVIILILLALDIVNIPLTVFAFLGGALAIGVGFGAQTLINNFLSGLILLIERPISLGDLVEVEGVRGRVREIGARCSRIHRADGIDMLIPNSLFLERNVTNLTLTDTQLRVSIKVGVAYGSPLREVTKLLEEAVESHGKVLKDPAPVILFEDFGDNALMFAVDFWVNVTTETDSRVVASDLRYMIERVFREAGISIAYPQRDVHLDQTRPFEIVMKPAGPEPEQGVGT
jgi:small-conductance mechanosensitive channel